MSLTSLPEDLVGELLGWMDKCMQTLMCMINKEMYKMVDKYTIRYENVACLGAEEGYLTILEWCKINNYNFNKASVSAAANGRTEVLEWMKINGKIIRYIEEYDVAAYNGHLETLKWLHKNEYEEEIYYGNKSGMKLPWKGVCNNAVLGGHLEILKWARTLHGEWDIKTCKYAAERGEYEILKWLREHGCYWYNKEIIEIIAEKGDIDMLEWAIANDCNGEHAYDGAARGGRIETLQWLKDSGYGIYKIFDRDPCANAAKGGSLEALKWLRENGCAWDNKTYEYAALQRNYDMMEWMTKNGYNE